MGSDGRHTSASSLTTNGKEMILNKKQNENQQQNGTKEKITRHRPSGGSVMTTRDPMAKQKISDICEPGPLKRAQGILNLS
jgi:hypothetical protein